MTRGPSSDSCRVLQSLGQARQETRERQCAEVADRLRDSERRRREGAAAHGQWKEAESKRQVNLRDQSRRLADSGMSAAEGQRQALWQRAARHYVDELQQAAQRADGHRHRAEARRTGAESALRRATAELRQVERELTRRRHDRTRREESRAQDELDDVVALRFAREVEL